MAPYEFLNVSLQFEHCLWKRHAVINLFLALFSNQWALLSDVNSSNYLEEEEPHKENYSRGTIVNYGKPFV